MLKIWGTGRRLMRRVQDGEVCDPPKGGQAATNNAMKCCCRLKNKINHHLKQERYGKSN